MIVDDIVNSFAYCINMLRMDYFMCIKGTIGFGLFYIYFGYRECYYASNLNLLKLLVRINKVLVKQTSSSEVRINTKLSNNLINSLVSVLESQFLRL